MNTGGLTRRKSVTPHLVDQVDGLVRRLRGDRVGALVIGDYVVEDTFSDQHFFATRLNHCSHGASSSADIVVKRETTT